MLFIKFNKIMVMKNIFLFLFLFLSINSFSQVSKNNDDWTWNDKILSKKEWNDSLHAFNIWYYQTYYYRQIQVKDSIVKLYSTRKYKRKFKK